MFSTLSSVNLLESSFETKLVSNKDTLTLLNVFDKIGISNNESITSGNMYVRLYPNE